MQQLKRQIKESNIIEAAETVFSKVGYKNAKMVDIATKAGITKVTLYSYFQSKENLYMSIAYKAMTLLVDEYHNTLELQKRNKGLQSTLALMETFMDFCVDNYLYSEAMLEYFTLVRSTSSGQDQSKLTEGLKESIYYMKLQDLQNLPFKLTIQEIKRGIADGSIHSDIDPALSTITGWASITGFARIISASGQNATPFLSVDLQQVKKISLLMTEKILTEGIS